MKRQLDDYISRFYKPEAKRAAKLAAHDFAKAREIVAWKEEVVSKWFDVQVLSVDYNDVVTSPLTTGSDLEVSCKIDTKGLGDSIGVELVYYRDHDGESTFDGTQDLKIVSKEGDIFTYSLKLKIKEAGMFRYALRMYPKNAELPHRMDFAYVRWI